MRNIYSAIILLIMLAVIPASIRAQITITSNDMPNTGDTLRYSMAKASSITAYNFQTTGSNHKWDFSSLQHSGQDVDTFVTVISTPILYYPSFITNANQAKKGPKMSLGTFSLTNVYDFYKKSTNSYTHVGFAATFNSVPIPTLYSSPDYEYRFPLTYGQTDSCNFGYNITIPTIFSYKNQSKRVNTVDGWGEITTPAGTFQAIRIKSVITSRDSVALDSLPISIPPTTTVRTEYKWLANGYRTPILTAVQPSIGPITVTYLDTYKPISGIENSEDKTIFFEAWPNPADKNIFLMVNYFPEASEPLYWHLYHPTGKLIKQGNVHRGTQPTTIDLEDIASGLYFISIQQGPRYSQSIKIIKK